MRRYIAAVIAATIAAFVAFMLAGCGSSQPVGHRATVKHLQQKAVQDCPRVRARTHVQLDVHGHPFLSHDLGACAPASVQKGLHLGAHARKGGAITSGQQGCDLSNNDPVHEGFAAIRRAGLTYCVLKVIEGVSFIDHEAGPMRFWADRYGVTVGGYDFGHVCLVSAISEAKLFASQLRAAQLVGLNRLIPWLDAEYGSCPSQAAAQAWVRTWVGQMGNEGYARVGVYTGPWWWEPHVGCYWPVNVPPWISGYPNAHPPRCAPSIVIHQFTDHFCVSGAGCFDANRLLGQPSAITNGVEEVVPADVKAANDRIVVLWGRRTRGVLHTYGRRDLDFQLRHVYGAGWSPHLSGPKHDAHLRASSWARGDCREVRKRWAQNRRGAYVQRLLAHMWEWEGDRCQSPRPHVVRFPGGVSPPSSPKVARR